MKKALLLTLALVFAIGLSASAQELSVNLDGGYLFGNYEEGDVTASHKGIVVSADAVVSGPWGAMLNFSSLESSDFEDEYGPVPEGMEEQTTSRFDILATYTLPVEVCKAKLALGYTNSSIDHKYEDTSSVANVLADGPGPIYGYYWEQDVTVSGAMVGVAGELSPAERFTLTGFAGFGIGLTVDGTRTNTDRDEYEVKIDDECNLTVLKAAAAYKVTDNVAIEAGYEYNKYAFDANDIDLTIDGFFLGARASF